MMQDPAIKPKSVKVKYILLSVLAFLIVAAIIGIQYEDYFGAQIKNLKNNHFSKGDKVHLSYGGMDGARYMNIPLYQLVTSSEGEKYIVFANKVIIYDSLLRCKDHCLGIYQHRKMEKFYPTKKCINFYSVHVDKKLIIDSKSKYKIPVGLEKTNDEYVIVWNYTSNKVEKRILSN
ncbi:hypothetical protein [Mucilaginibacter terrae]|uniref:Uncharacterized protein n=1 Tax=Mucilaginibacter terrae TaxID=1955052 RepID=A0ABU3GZC1_9SPHI|nr:hypothetical protein [Mucilaginibacter terrae]MDT3405109.1 hypothetical protein [Mucilaginibacter terrae]